MKDNNSQSLSRKAFEEHVRRLADKDWQEAVRWLLKFASQNLTAIPSASRAQWRAEALAVTAWACGEAVLPWIERQPIPLPSWTEIIRWQRIARRGLDIHCTPGDKRTLIGPPMVLGRPVNALRARLLGQRMGITQLRPVARTPAQAFQWSVVRLLLNMGEFLRVCRGKDCHARFVASTRRQTWCTPGCKAKSLMREARHTPPERYGIRGRPPGQRIQGGNHDDTPPTR